MSNVSFEDYFYALHDRRPFHWQSDLAAQVVEEGWPESIDLPTASGKTACLDIALYHLAVGENAARRIFFVVDRRVVVNEAFLRMRKVAEKLAAAKEGPLIDVADRLREVGQGEQPLRVVELRGGIYRDTRWVRSLLQPTVVTSTVDQVGSRLLFRGYGLSDSVKPIHAALVANDALVILDEAHCSRAFSQTVKAVQVYRNEWRKEHVPAPFTFVEMTATPAVKDARVFRLPELDWDETGPLSKRLYAEKPTELVRVKGAVELAAKAKELAKSSELKRIAVMVNRVATAKAVFAELSKHSPVELLIGRMRPIDRDDVVSESLSGLKSGVGRSDAEATRYVVSTQSLEVGADLDFDGLVSECASIDALLQRFGRLDRLGSLGGKARGVVALLGTPKEDDPIYGPAILRTWNWLEGLSGNGPLNFGVAAKNGTRKTVREELAALGPEEGKHLSRESASAPVLFPSHLDAWVQTSHEPHVEPEPALFLHGREDGLADVQVVWRRDLHDKEWHWESWKEIVSACPPVSAEALPARLWEVRRWMRGEGAPSLADSDLEGVGEFDRSRKPAGGSEQRTVLIWRGDRTDQPTRNPEDVRPGDTVVIPCHREWETLGHVPHSGLTTGADRIPRDWGDRAAFAVRLRPTLRFKAELMADWPESPVKPGLLALLGDDEADWEEQWKPLLREYAETLMEGIWLREAILQVILVGERNVRTYPAVKDEKDKEERGLIVRYRRPNNDPEEDAGSDELVKGEGTLLPVHTRQVESAVAPLAERLVPEKARAFQLAALWHDAGKADVRFQAALRAGDRMAADLAKIPLAKSERWLGPLWKQICEEAGVPKGFRHELLSVQLAQLAISGEAERDVDLILHLIGSHHGYCRPYAPIVRDPRPLRVHWNGIELGATERERTALHRLDSGASSRFWKLCRTYGWWGLAYLESILRLADWEASSAVETGGTRES